MGSSRNAGAWPLVGREEELALAHGRLAEHAAGGVLIAGEPGVGKSRLAHEIAATAAASGRDVQWVRATRSAASIPLGAFAALLPAQALAVGSPAELLARTRQAVLARGGGSGLVLCVDDAHLLDDASAALVHGLVAGADIFAVLTVRRGEPAPDAVQALWKDELLELVELGALGRDDVARLLAAALGGAVEGRSADLLARLTRGNALFLRELVLHGVQQRTLAQEGGIWRWRGEPAVGMRLAELVATRLAGLTPAARAALDLVAVGAPLEIGLLRADELDALEEAERSGLVAWRDDPRRRDVDVGHPLHAEVIRARLARTRLQAIQARLADGVEACGARRRGDVLRIGVWRLECGCEGDPRLFTRAAEQALARLDWALAERLARAAERGGGGFGARIALARALAGLGRAGDADALLAQLEPGAPGDCERVAVAVARASNLFWGLDRTDAADAILRGAERDVADPALRDELTAMRAWLDCTFGRPREALDAAAPLLSRAGTSEPTALRAALTVATALTMRGRSDDAIATVDAWLDVARRHHDELPLLEGQLLGTRPLALQLAGRLVEATAAAQRAYDFECAARSADGSAFAAFALGSTWLARGRVRSALRWFRESATLAREADPVGLLPWPLTGIAQAAAEAGDGDLAQATLAELDVTPARGTRNFETALALTRAWGAAVAGELSRARRDALAAAQRAEALGQDAFAVRALHDLTRFGDPAAAAPRLAALAGHVDGPFARAAAAHAAALVDGDGAALLDVAERFAEQDALLHAAEAANAAAAAYRRAGREASARTAAQRAATLLDGCEGARPPTIVAEPAVEELTEREREVALLAAAGLSSRAIAERLVVSIRTVDNHLQRAYRKLGISRRDELRRLLE